MRPPAPMLCTGAERAAIVAAGEAMYEAMAAIIAKYPLFAHDTAVQRAEAVLHLAQQGLALATADRIGSLAPPAIIGACGRILGDVISQAPQNMHGPARRLLEAKMLEGAVDHAKVSTPQGTA